MKKNLFTKKVEGQYTSDTEDDDAKKQREKETKYKLETVQRREFMEDLYKDLERVIGNYYQSSEITFTFERAKGFFIELEKLRVNFDPDFYFEMGLNKSELMFGMCHEAEHFRDMMTDADEYKLLFERIEQVKAEDAHYGEALFRFYNILDDVMVNLTVIGRWASCSPKFVANIYHKLFPHANYKGQPKHIQFADALIREAMIPDEKIEVDADVREVLDKISKSHVNVRTLSAYNRELDGCVHNPNLRHQDIERHLETHYRNFYEIDKKNNNLARKPQHGKKGEFGEPKDIGQANHQEIAEKIDDIKKRINEQQKEKASSLFGNVELREIELYMKDVREHISENLERMIDFFRLFLKKRIVYEKITKLTTKEGTVAPQHLVDEYIGAITGSLEGQRIYITDVLRKKIEQFFSEFELTIVVDGSGSMRSETKYTAQRLAVLTMLEAISHFTAEIEDMNKQGESINMELKTQLRIYSDDDDLVKQFEQEMNLENRVRISKKLVNLPGGGTNEHDTLCILENEIRQKREQIISGKLKKLVIFTSDGESSYGSINEHIAKIYALVKNVPNFRIIGIGLGPETPSVAATYAPHGFPNIKLNELADLLITELSAFIEADINEAELLLETDA